MAGSGVTERERQARDAGQELRSRRFRRSASKRIGSGSVAAALRMSSPCLFETATRSSSALRPMLESQHTCPVMTPKYALKKAVFRSKALLLGMVDHRRFLCPLCNYEGVFLTA